MSKSRIGYMNSRHTHTPYGSTAFQSLFLRI